MASGVAAAHAAGVLHLDIKPSNVVISTDGRVRVLDFGVARILSRRPPGDQEFFDSRPELQTEPLASPTVRDGKQLAGFSPSIEEAASNTAVTVVSSRPIRRNGPLLGTPAYMAPEQFAGFSSKATDVWALGTIAYELCVGVRPYRADSIDALMHAVTSQDPVPVTPAFRDLPSALSELILQCLAKDPVERPSAEEVAVRLVALDLRPPSSDSDETTPFRALRPFSEQDAAVFFGRDSEIAACLERLRIFSFVPVVGPSGVGKSSLVRAGVIPKLLESANWSIVRLRPGPRPLRALAARLLAPSSTTRTALSTKDQYRDAEPTVRDVPAARTAPGAPRESNEAGEQIVETDDPDRLAAALLKSPDMLAALLRKSADADGCRVLVFVDQLEEVVTMCESPQERSAFMAALCAASGDVEEPVRVLVTIRDDFPGRIPWGPFAQTVLSGMLMLGAPSDESLRDTIIRPLRARGYAFDDPALLDAILDAVRGEEMRLPLLQFCMTQLWQDRDQAHRKLLRSAYSRMGEVGGALAAHAERAVGALSPSELNAARTIFLRLLNPEGMRRMITRSRLLAGVGNEAESAVNTLVHARLLAVRKGESQGEDEPVVELAHESLPKLWKRLAAWFSESKEEIRALSNVMQAAESWERRGRGADGLWAGDALLEARLAISRASSPAPPVALEFINACERRQTRQRRRRRLIAGGVTAATATTAVFASVAAWALGEKAEAQAEGRVRAERERARTLEESALAALANQDIPKASGQLRALLESGDSPNARLAWQRISTTHMLWRKRFGYHTYAVSFHPGSDRFAAASRSGNIYELHPLTLATTTLRGHRDQVLSIDYTPSGSHLLSAALDGEVRVWDTATRQSDAYQLGSGPATSIKVAPKGDRAAVGWDHGGVTVVSLPDCRKVSTFAHDHRDVRALTWTADGSRLAVGAPDGSIRTFRVSTGEQTHELKVHKSVSSLATSPDGSSLAVGTRDGTVMLCEETGAKCRELDQGHEAVVRSLAFTPDGLLMASGSQDSHVSFWDAKSGGLRTQIDVMLGSVLSVDFDATGTRLAVSGQQGVELWKVPERASTPSWRARGLFGPVWTTELSPDERWVLAGGEGRFAVLDRRTADPVAVIDTGSAEVRALASLPDSQRVVLVLVSGRVEIRSLPHGRLLDEKASPALTGTISGALIRAADGKLRVVTGLSDGRLAVWSVEPLRPVRTILGHRDSVRTLAASPTGLQFVSGGADGILRIWDTTTWSPRVLLRRSDSIWGTAFHPDGEHVGFVTDSGYVGLVDLRGKSRRVWQHSHRLWRVAIHPDGTQLAVASADGNAYLVDLSSGASTSIERFGDEVNDVRFSSSGRVMLSASDDG
ncbi:MAG: protein kinase, partial [Polyangiaceae bacterium]|nr:protein kinase [Polyangiaceae bacterium]